MNFSVESMLFWVLFWLTVAAALAPLLWGMREPRRLLTAPTIVGAMSLYFYGYMAYGAATTLTQFLPEWMFTFGQGVALACLLGFYVGWWRGKPREDTTEEVAAQVVVKDDQMLRVVAVLLIVGGGVGHYLFIAQESIDWQNTSAYWYLAFHLGYVGMVLWIIVLHRTGNSRGEWIALIIASALTLAPHLFNARRGPLVPAVMIFALLPHILRGTAPRRGRFVLTLGATAFVMLLFVQVRPWVYSEKSGDTRTDGWQTALSTLSAERVVSSRVTTFGDNEYLYHCGLVATVFELDMYQYGTGYLSLVTHWVPRALWREKPGLGQGWYPDANAEMETVLGWTMTKGAAPAGVAQTFNQLGFFAPLLWLGMGFVLRRAYERAVNGKLENAAVYVCAMAASHWAVSQGLDAAFVPLSIYLFVTLMALKLAAPAKVKGGQVQHPAQTSAPREV